MESSKQKLRILFIGKADDHYSKTAADFIKLHFEDPLIVFSKRTEPFPSFLEQWEGDLLISYLAQWIIPGSLLQKARMAAINFHPGPPEYPGIGCTNFAVYNGETSFGITCHHMLEKVDSGSLIGVRRFPILPGDTVYSITQRCYNEILHLFYHLISELIAGGALPGCSETWTRKPYTRKQLNALCELTPDMDQAEIDRRLKATTYGTKVWAYMKDATNMSYSSDKK
jgi:methionyl-tRNA formyltransferase